MTARYLGLAVLAAFAGEPATAQIPLQLLASPVEQPGGRFGNAIAGAPDVDGDGVADIFVGAAAEDVASAADAGRAFIFSGSTGVCLRVLESPSSETGGVFGHAVSAVADSDGDGRPDLLVGARGEAPGTSPDAAGRAYLFSGATASLIRELMSPSEEQFGLFGTAVAGLTDVDGDGRGDVAIGAANESPGTSPDGAGRVYVFSGATGSLLHTLASPNEEAGGLFGHSVSMVPDADGDTVADILIGADFEDPGASPDGAGRAYLFSGATGTLLRELQSPNEEQGGFFGGAVSGAEDLDGDGRGDLLIAADFEDPGASPLDAGRAYAFSGATGALLHVLAAPVEGEIGRFGFSVAGISDLDGDARGEILVGAPFDNPGGSPVDTGRAYLFNGGTGEFLRELASPNEQSGGSFGNSVSRVGDVDGDGMPDVIAGAYRESQGASPVDAGRVYVFSGDDLTHTEPQPASRIGLSVAPNPVDGAWVVSLALDVPAMTSITVHDALGRQLGVVHEGSLPSGTTSFPLDLALPDGSYFVRAATPARTAAVQVAVVGAR